jgi:Regulator of chromosome condensation (RCC1) repeat
MRSITPRIGSRLTRIVTAAALVGGVLVLAAPAAQAINVASVSVGAVSACVHTVSDGALCWGYNDTGMVGDGTRIDRRTPTQVQGLKTGVQDVQAVWDHSCALTNGGGVKCWGHNGDGELGDGSLTRRLVPVGVQGLNSGVSQISLGFDSGCALVTGTDVECWGYNGNGQLGDNTRSTRKTPTMVALPLGVSVKQISAGWDHTCAVTTTNSVLCWGDNASGEVGDGTRTDRLKPVLVTGLAGVAQVSAGYDHTCALLTGGTVKCWGNNDKGELGDGTTKQRRLPVTVSGLSGVASISAGFDHTCAVTSAGAAKCWGANESGELGDGTTRARHVPHGVYNAGTGVAQISAGGYKGAGMTCLTTTAGAVKCFGANHGIHGLAPITSHGGQLGDGTKTNRLVPITVRNLNGASPAHYRPDLLISKHKAAGYAGNGIYNSTGAKQTRAQAMSRGGTRHFFVKLQNDSGKADTFFLIGPGTGKGFIVKYTSGAKVITKSVTKGTYWVSVPAGGTRFVSISVTAKKTTKPGAKRSLKLTVRSAGDSAKVDAVKANVKTR